ncbi:MAG: RHS repeat-associated core domain-containing protein [Gemmatimonadetes bacterium]|nr:RHS repeat-associated core domain-containing protein [Gemmatimonadota bacterium]
MDSMFYDALGRRVRKQMAAADEYYVYEGAQVIFDLNAAGTVLREYAWYPGGVDQLLALRTTTPVSDTLAAILDPINGTVRGLARLRTGAKVKEYAEAPWGDAVADTGVVVRYRFAGREYDSESGLYYMRARYYDPALGRWISEDPIGVEGGHNLFGYSGNDPVNVVDPWGLDPLCGEGWVQIVTRGVDENGVPTWDLKCEKAGGAGNGGFIGPGTGRNAPPGSSFPHRPAGPRGRGQAGLGDYDRAGMAPAHALPLSASVPRGAASTTATGWVTWPEGRREVSWRLAESMQRVRSWGGAFRSLA